MTQLCRLGLKFMTLLYERTGLPRPSDNLYDCLEQARTRGLLPNEIYHELHVLRGFSNQTDHDRVRLLLTADRARRQVEALVDSVSWLVESSGALPVYAVPEVVSIRFCTTEHFNDRVLQLQTLRDVLLADAHRLVSLVGRGGVGKTALIAKLGAEVEQGLLGAENPKPYACRAVLYVSFQDSVRPPLEHLVTLLADTLVEREKKQLLAEWRRDSGLTPTGRFRALLARLGSDRRILIIDNLEAVLDLDGRFRDLELGSFIELCLTTDHGLRILATSKVQPLVPLDCRRRHLPLFIEEGLPDVEY